MVFKNFSISLIIRVLILTLLLAVFVYSMFILHLVFTTIVVGVVTIFSVVELVRFVNKSNRNLALFLESIRYRDYTVRYPEKATGKSSDQLHKAFNLIVTEFKNLQFEKELHSAFLKTIVETVPVGILCINSSGKVILYNEAARKIIGVNHLPSLSQLEKLVPDLSKGIENINNERPEVISLQKEDQKLDISLRVLPFKLEDQAFRIVTFQNIKGELELYEVEAWQKLIRVLTHEIMNSVTPITSLAGTLSDLLNDPLDEDTEKDVRQGIQAIRNRSKGLLDFVEHYRKFARIPKPAFNSFEIAHLFSRLRHFYEGKTADSGIRIQFNGGENQFITADEEQLEQVMINLINNSLDAVKDTNNPTIEVTADETDKRPVIVIEDNGTGISEENKEKIFVPFFTTKPQGSGIGLSLSRQILLRNKAGITFRNGVNGGTVFTIRF